MSAEKVEGKFLLFAHHKGTEPNFRNLGLILVKDEDDLGLLQEALSEKANLDVYDCFYFSLAKNS